MPDCCKYSASQFKHRVTIQSSSKVSDGQGGFTETWTDGATVWASIDPVKAWERMQAQQMQTPITHKIVMRYRNDVTSASRLKFGDRILWVREVINPGEAKKYLEIKAQERS